MMDLDFKFVAGILGAVIGNAAFIPYFWDIFRKRTKPHAYTWLIWCLTQGTAVAGMWYGGSGLGALGLTVGVGFVGLVFLLSLVYGTRNVTRSDTVILIAAVAAILVWWQLDNPLLAIAMAATIDLFGFIPTWRKTIVDPWSETLWTWITFSIGNLFAIAGLLEYNLLTLTYIVAITIANLVVAAICIYFRRKVPKPIAAV
jgi:hypothetical protein